MKQIPAGHPMEKITNLLDLIGLPIDEVRNRKAVWKLTSKLWMQEFCMDIYVQVSDDSDRSTIQVSLFGPTDEVLELVLKRVSETVDLQPKIDWNMPPEEFETLDVEFHLIDKRSGENLL